MDFARPSARLLAPALFLLVLSVYEFSTYRATASQQSTFNIPPGDYYQLTATRSASDTVSGQFQETSGSPVSFYVFTSAQFASFQLGTSLDSVYNVTDSSSSTIAYTFKAQDTFYLIFRHGSGLLNTTETVYFQRTYAASDSTKASLAFIFLIFGAFNLVLAFRKRKPRMENVPPVPTGVAPQGQPSETEILSLLD